MRNLLTVLLSLVCAALVVLGVLRFVGVERASPPGDARNPAAAGPGAPGTAGDAYADGFVDGAEMASRALLEGGLAPPVAAEEGSADGASRAVEGNPDADSQRAAMLARVEERFRRQAEYIGKALELSTGDQERLFEVLVGEYERRADFFEEMRKDAFDPELRARVREELMGIQDWKTRELEAKLGAELARAVQDFEHQNDRGLFDRSFEREGKERHEN